MRYINSRFTYLLTYLLNNNAFNILDVGFPYWVTILCNKQTSNFCSDTAIWRVMIVVKRYPIGLWEFTPVGWPEADAILPSAAFDNVDLSGESGQSGISVLHYFNKHMNVHRSTCECSDCGKCFKSSRELREHIEVISEWDLLNVGPTICTKRLTTSVNLVCHSRVHSGEKRHRCHMCDKMFTHSGHLNTLMKDETNRASVCCVHKVSVTAATCRNINVMSTSMWKSAPSHNCRP